MRSAANRRRLTWIAVAVALAGAVVAVLALAPGAGPPATATSATATSAEATAAPATSTAVSAEPVGRAIRPGFVGLSLELYSLERYAGTDPAALDPVFLRLVGQLAPGGSPVLRLGGDSTDWSWWPVAGMRKPPGIRYTLTPQWMAVAHAVAARLHARLILGVNLEADSVRLAAAEGRAMVSAIGSQEIEALEIGNEPELYARFGWYRTKSGREVPGRARGYDVSDFIAQFTRYARALPRVPLAGPTSGAPTWLAQLPRFLSTEPRVRLATIHAYPLKRCTHSTVITVGQLLSNAASHGLAQQLLPYVRAAGHAGVPLRVDEINGVSCGGMPGVSDSFASALWMLDTLFELARAGVAGVNVETVPGKVNEVLGPEDLGGRWMMRVHPEYYGMIMFTQAAPPGSRLLAVQSRAPAGIKVWATRAPGGAIHVVVIDKRRDRAGTVVLRIAGARGPATLERLRAPSARAPDGVTLGGRSFGAATSTGELAGTASEPAIDPVHGVYEVRMPAASAAMLTIAASA